MALFSTWSQFVTGASARSEDFRKSQQIDTKTYIFQPPISISSNKNIWSIFQPVYLPNHKLYVPNFLPINNTVQHIFNGKTYIFNDTNYLLIFTTFVTFGVPYVTCVTVVILCPVHTYPDIFESATFSFRIRLSSTRIRRIRKQIRKFFNPLSRVEIFESDNISDTCGRSNPDIF